MSTGGEKPVETDRRHQAKPPRLMRRCIYCGQRTWLPVACANCADLLDTDPVRLVRGNGNGNEAA